MSGSQDRQRKQSSKVLLQNMTDLLSLDLQLERVQSCTEIKKTLILVCFVIPEAKKKNTFSCLFNKKNAFSVICIIFDIRKETC